MPSGQSRPTPDLQAVLKTIEALGVRVEQGAMTRERFEAKKKALLAPFGDVSMVDESSSALDTEIDTRDPDETLVAVPVAQPKAAPRTPASLKVMRKESTLPERSESAPDAARSEPESSRQTPHPNLRSPDNPDTSAADSTPPPLIQTSAPKEPKRPSKEEAEAPVDESKGRSRKGPIVLALCTLVPLVIAGLFMVSSSDESQKQSETAKAQVAEDTAKAEARIIAEREAMERSRTEEARSAQAIAVEDRPWWCLCYKERVEGIATLSTACRKTQDVCTDLEEKITYKGSRALVKGSVKVSCQHVSGAHPSDSTSSARYDWKASSRNRGWWSPEGCFLSGYDGSADDLEEDDADDYALPSRLSNSESARVYPRGDRAYAEELNTAGYRARKQGDNRSARSLYAEAVSQSPDYEMARFNLACEYALARNADAAIAQLEHLWRMGTARALKRLRKIATDSDFERIDNDPRFLAILRAIEE